MRRRHQRRHLDHPGRGRQRHRRGRRTIGSFRPDVPPKDIVLEALDLARWAPNHKKTEPWHAILLGPETAKAVVALNAKIITATRRQVLSIPIIALTVRENTPLADADAPETFGRNQSKKQVGQRDVEGAFVIDQKNKVTFRPIRVGVSGDGYFEVLSGLRAGEKIVAGPYQAIRELKDGTTVRAAPTNSAGKKK